MKNLRIILPKAWINIQEYFLPLLIIAFVTESIILLGNTLLLPIVDTIHIESSFINIEYIKGLLGLLLPIVLFPLTLSAITYLITTEDSKLSTSIHALKFLKPKLSLLLLWGCIWFLGIFIGLELLAFPGIFILISMIFVGPLISNEHSNLQVAVKQSFQLVKKNVLSVSIILLFFIFLQTGIAFQGASFIITALPFMSISILRWILSIILLPLVYVPLAQAFLFYQSEQLPRKAKKKTKKKGSYAQS